MLRRIAVYIVLLWSVLVQATAYTPRTVPNPRTQFPVSNVANPDGIINGDDVSYLDRCAQLLNNRTQVELCVVALQSIGDAEAFNFTYELFQRWGIGKQNKNTGVLILFVLDSHDIRIMTGTGIEGVLTDAQCSRIISEEMTPLFRSGDYGGGLCRGATRIYEICTQGSAPEELRNMKSVTNRGGFEKEESQDDESWAGFIVLLVFLALVIWVIWKSWGSPGGGNSGGYSGGGYYGGGYGGYSGGYSGGFGGGGFGGGSTSGGGAGGKW